MTLTTDVGKILASLHRVQSKGDINFLTAVKIAHVSTRRTNLLCECVFKLHVWFFPPSCCLPNSKRYMYKQIKVNFTAVGLSNNAQAMFGQFSTCHILQYGMVDFIMCSPVKSDCSGMQ